MARSKRDLMADLRAKNKAAAKSAKHVGAPTSLVRYILKERCRRWRCYTFRRENMTIARRSRKWTLSKSVGGWGSYQCGPYIVLLQRGSSDEYALEELFKKNVYGKSLATGQTWIDVGGHRGLFAILALMAGAKQVYSYEPHPGSAMVYSWNCRGGRQLYSGRLAWRMERRGAPPYM